jgi:hypothetical protein
MGGLYSHHHIPPPAGPLADASRAHPARPSMGGSGCGADLDWLAAAAAAVASPDAPAAEAPAADAAAWAAWAAVARALGVGADGRAPDADAWDGRIRDLEVARCFGAGAAPPALPAAGEMVCGGAAAAEAGEWGWWGAAGPASRRGDGGGWRMCGT